MQALWMVLAAFFFATMAVGIKFASQSFHALEILFYRGLVSLVFMAIVLRASKVSLATAIPMMHLWRSAIGVFAMGAWFYAIGHLPLAMSMTLNYMSSVWVAVFVVAGGMLYGRVRDNSLLMGTVLLGFAGVIITLRPTIEQNQLFAGLVGLLSGIAAAMAQLQVTALGKAGEPEVRTVFYFSLGTTLLGTAAALFQPFTPWSQVSTEAAMWLVPIGIFASLGQWCMTRAYSHGATLVVANMQYSGIVFASIYSLALFGEQIPLLGWLGMTLIVISGILATILRTAYLKKVSISNEVTS
jgi:S-adenosylmethionine uptake transporter